MEDVECSKCENLTKKAFQRMAEIGFPKLKHIGLPIENFGGKSTDILTDDIYYSLAQACPCLESLENIAAPQKDAVENGVHEEVNSRSSAIGDVTLTPLQIQALCENLTVVHDKPVYVYGRLRDGVNSSKREKWFNDLQSLSAACPGVTSFRCRRGQRYMDNGGLENIGKIFPNLCVLELHHTSVDDEGLKLFFAQHKGILTEIIFDNPGNLTDVALEVISLYCPKLEYLKLSHVAGITNEGVEFLVQRCTSLAEIHLNNSAFSFRNEDNENRRHFSNDCLASISKNCPYMGNLRLLNSNEVCAPGIKALAKGCRFLRGIMLYECPLIDDKCLEILREIPFLKVAVLVNCNGITPAGIIHLVLRAPNLFRLTLLINTDDCTTFYGDHSATAEKVYDLIDAEDHTFRPCSMRKLTLKGVGGNFLQLLTVLCPDLHTLDLREAVLMNHVAFRNVLINCENLRVLDIQNVHNLSDSHLSSLSEFGHNVQKVALGRNVKNLSTEALSKVINTCPSLKYVSMDFNSLIKVPGIDQPSEAVPPCSGTTSDPRDVRHDDNPNEKSDKYPDLDVLLNVARDSHGGSCYLHVVTDEKLSPFDPSLVFPVHRHIEFHFTPIKYLNSINTRLSTSPQ